METTPTSVATATAVRPSPSRPASRAWIVPTVFVGIAALAGASWFWTHRPGSTSDGAMAREDDEAEAAASGAMPVEVTRPKAGGIEIKTEQAGSVHAFQHAAIFAKLSGYLKEQNVDIGDRVTRGQLLAVIDDPEVDKSVDQAVAALDQSKARVRVAEAMVRSALANKAAAEAKVRQVEADVAAKISNQDLQAKQLKRIEGLVTREAVEPKLLDEQKDRFDVSVSELGVTRAGVLTARADTLAKAALVEESDADLVEAKSNVEIAEANLAKARVMQDYTRISSPYDGVVTLRSFHRGDFIRSATEGGNVPVLSVARTDLMRVILPIPDTYVPFLDRGDPAVLRIVALPGREFSGKVSRFANSEDPESRNMRTEVDLPNPDGKLHDGMYGRMTVILAPSAPKSLTIPSSGVIEQDGKGDGAVYVVRDGKARKVSVRIGNDNGIQTEILSGLSANDPVITRYNGPLGDGTPVLPESTKAPAAKTTGH